MSSVKSLTGEKGGTEDLIFAMEEGMPLGSRRGSVSSGVSECGVYASVSANVSPMTRIKRAKRMIEAAGVSAMDDEPESVNEQNDSEKELKRMRMIGSRLRKFLFAEANRISKGASEFILNSVSEYEEILVRMSNKNERLSGKLEVCEERVSANVAMPTTYASVTGMNKKSERGSVFLKPERVKERSYAIVVKGMNDNEKMSSEQLKEKVLRDVSKDLDVRVKAMRKTRSGGVVIETVSEGEWKKVRECKKFEKLGLKVDLPRKIGPKVIVYDVENEMTNDEFMNALYVKNLKEYVTENEFKTRVRVVSRTSKKGMNVGNVIVEVSAQIKKRLCDSGRVYVKWKSFKVREFMSVMRCYKCLRLVI